MSGIIIHSNAPAGFPLDALLREVAQLRQMLVRLEQARGALAHPAMAGVETADTPETLADMIAWTAREIELRDQAVTDYAHGIEPAWPPRSRLAPSRPTNTLSNRLQR